MQQSKTDSYQTNPEINKPQNQSSEDVLRHSLTLLPPTLGTHPHHTFRAQLSARQLDALLHNNPANTARSAAHALDAAPKRPLPGGFS